MLAGLTIVGFTLIVLAVAWLGGRVVAADAAMTRSTGPSDLERER